VSMSRPPRCANECDSNLREMNASKEKPRLGRGASPAPPEWRIYPVGGSATTGRKTKIGGADFASWRGRQLSRPRNRPRPRRRSVRPASVGVRTRAQRAIDPCRSRLRRSVDDGTITAIHRIRLDQPERWPKTERGHREHAGEIGFLVNSRPSDMRWPHSRSIASIPRCPRYVRRASCCSRHGRRSVAART
jgi:hypothetical protein